MGVPIPNASAPGNALRGKRITVLRDRLKERSGWYAEPDVVLDFGERIIFVEAKLTSKNDRKEPDYGGWNTYLNDDAFRDKATAIRSQLYQLARNWRVALELAQGCSFQVVNLAPSFSGDEHRSLAMLRSSVRVTRDRRLT